MDKPSRGYTAYVLGIICLVSFFNYMDRMLLAVLVEPIKAEFGFSDTQMGLLFGFAFAVFYAVMGIPIARLADTRPRVALLSLVMATWSAATALCGAVQNFLHLFLARVLVGVGEAGCLPASYSLIGDYFPAKSRPIAMGIFQAGGALGVMIGIFSAGAIAEAFGWRWAFVILGIPGVLIAILAWLTVREPRRGNYDDSRLAPAHDFRAAFVVLFRLRTYLHLTVAFTLSLFILNGIINWIPAFLMRLHGMSLADMSFWLALTFGLGNALGMALGGFAVRPLIKLDPRWELWFPAFAYGIAVPLYLAAFLVPRALVSVGFLFIASLVAAMALGPALAAVQRVVEANLRATAIAIITFCASVFSLGFGGLLIGYLSDMLAPAFLESSLKIALSVTLVIPAWSIVHYLLAARTLRQDDLMVRAPATA